jgi:hypothetical protein
MSHRTWITGFHTRCFLPSRLRSAGLVFMLAVPSSAVQAQVHLSPTFHPEDDDLSVLASPERRAELSCKVTPYKPSLGFDLRFHSEYRVKVPLRVLADVGGRLQVLLRVVPTIKGEKPVYLSHQYSIPDVPLPAEGEGELTGGFDLGAGHYQVDWMMRDGLGRVCSSHWELKALSPGGQQDLPLALEPNRVAARLDSVFDEEPPAERASTSQLRVKLLLNFSPVDAQDSVMKLGDAEALLSMLRGVTREPRVGRLTLVAFNLREQKVVDRQDNAGTIDFSQLGRALKSRSAGTVDYHLLQDPSSETHFVTKLLTEQLGAAAESQDAIIIIGPKVTLQNPVPLDLLKQAGTGACPIYYLNYNLNPFDRPWRDTIGSALKAYRNAVAYDILVPRDLGSAMKDIFSRLAKHPAAEVTTGAF